MLKINQIYLGDCLEIMKEIPDKSIDVVITDPPYRQTDLKFDSDISKWYDDCIRLVKDNGYLCSFGDVQIQSKIFLSGWKYRFSGIWLKQRGSIRTHNAKMPPTQSEPYIVYSHPNSKIKDLIYNTINIKGIPYKKIRKNIGYKREGIDFMARADSGGWTKNNYDASNTGTRIQTSVIFSSNKTGMPKNERTTHPTQKPIFVIETLIKWLTIENQIVFDPFAGSGTTALACKNLNRNFILIEKNEKYYQIAKQRIEQT